MTAVRLIVLDGVDWEWCQQNSELMSNLNRIGLAGARARLQVCNPPLTSEAVAALLTGRMVSCPWDDERRYATSQRLIRERPWFGHVARQGITFSLCNVPVTWPAFSVPDDCWMVSGYPIGNKTRWYDPPSLDVKNYPIKEILADKGAGGSSDLKAVREYEGRLVDWYLEVPRRCDLELVWLRSGDSAGHHAWGTREYNETMQWLDRAVLKLVKGSNNVVILSDHGFDALDSVRCKSYRKCHHGPAAVEGGLVGGHTEDGIFYCLGTDIPSKGLLKDQTIFEIVAGLFRLLKIPNMVGMNTKIPGWMKSE